MKRNYILIPIGGGGGGKQIELSPLEVTENGVYTAGEDKGYSEVSVSVATTNVSVVSSVISTAPVSFTALNVTIKVGSNKTMTSYGVDYSTDNFQNYQSVTNSGTFWGEKTFTITGLVSGTTYQVRSFVIVDGVRYDQEPFNTIATTSMPVYPESVPAKATMMTTTDLSSSKTVTMGYGSTAMPDENFYVDWGDGSDIQLYTANTSVTVSHTYSETGKKTIYCWSDSTTDTEYGKMPPFKSTSGYDSWLQIESIETPLQKIYGGSTHYTANGTGNNSMFRRAKQLKIVCDNLFENYCDSTQPLANNSYQYMFRECTNLTTAPELPATTLADYCYYYMFQDCTSLTTAPVLPATTLANWCYNYMFQNCTNLQSVTTYATTWNTSYASSWLQDAGTNATETPTIYCPADSTLKNYTDNVSGIPTGWTQVDLTE